MNYTHAVPSEFNDPTGDVKAAYFPWRKGRATAVKELARGAVFANYDRRGELRGVEMPSPCKASVRDRIGLQAPAKRFIRRAMPRRTASA